MQLPGYKLYDKDFCLFVHYFIPKTWISEDRYESFRKYLLNESLKKCVSKQINKKIRYCLTIISTLKPFKHQIHVNCTERDLVINLSQRKPNHKF